jgi:hypothetical protein
MVIVASLSIVASSAEAATCPRHVNDVTNFGPKLTGPIVLTPASGSEQRVTNFGSQRGTNYIKGVRINSDKPLPASIGPHQINFESLIRRSGESLASVDFPEPTFTDPRFSADRKHFTFTICMNANGVEPGKYVGALTVSGSEGLGEASVATTANLKAGLLLWAGLTALAMALSGGALYWKAASKNTPTGRAWWLKTVFALVVAFGLLAKAYDGDPAWGADTLNAFLAVVGTAFASIGGRKLLE